MRNLMINIAVGLILTLISFTAYANWQCRIHNAKGNVWTATGGSRKAAAAAAMGMCAGRGVTGYAMNCTIDWCQQGNYGTPAAQHWQCNIANDRGQSWYGVGTSRKQAAMNAMGLCAGRGNSAYARNCHITKCFMTY